MSSEQTTGSGLADPRLMTEAETAAYWDARHRRQDDLRSGGHIGLDAAGNELFYARRLGALLEIVGDRSNPADPLFVLDAGCGKGHFARALARCGHRVDAVDASAIAIASCRRRAEDSCRRRAEDSSESRAERTGSDDDDGSGTGREVAGPRFFHSTLARWNVPYLYDVVYAVDVFFHILDDAQWQASLVNVASLVRLSGTLVVTDEPGPARVQRGTYILHRGVEEYRRVLEPRGLRFREFRPYDFRENRVGFHVFTRIH